MKSLQDGFDYLEFVREGYAQQSKYDKKAGFKYTADELVRVDEMVKVAGTDLAFYGEAMKHRYRMVADYIAHMIEEIHEARAYVPRRTWKNEEVSFLDDSDKRGEFVAEMFDILLFHRAVLAYAGIAPEEFLDAARKKLKYNDQRKDHNINGTEAAHRDPKAELQGDCPSSEALRAYEKSGPKFSAGSDEVFADGFGFRLRDS